MDESQKQNAVLPEPPSDKELAEQLERSRQLVAEAEIKHQRADDTVSDMAKTLRRIAAAMNRNPESWDDLFLKRERP